MPFTAGSITFVTRALTALTWLTSCQGLAQNYVGYHHEAVKAYKYRLAGDHKAALAIFLHLLENYVLLPPETYAMGYSYCVLGDTAKARTYLMAAAKQGSSAGWLDGDRDSLLKYISPEWFNDMNEAYFTTVLNLFPYREGPNPGQPVPTSRINERYQAVIDSLSGIYGGYGNELDGHFEAQAFYSRLRRWHDFVLDSILAGSLPLPSIQLYGMNGEFDTFTFHTTPYYLFAQRDSLKAWLNMGWIFPQTYANCFDQVDREEGRRLTYGVLLGSKVEDLMPGYEERRHQIGMGDDAVDSLRFHWR